MSVFSMFHPEQPGLSIDLLVQHPIPFDELWEQLQVFDVDWTGIRVCSLDDLINLKQLAERNKDMDDIEKLLKIKDHGKS